MTLSFELILQSLIALAAITFLYYTARTKIPLIPTQAAARDIILSLIYDELKTRPGQKVKIYDLGAGLGGLCLAIARKFPEAEVVGLEMGWPMWLVASLRQKLTSRANARFQQGNFWNYDVSDGDIIVFYLGAVVMQKMGDKLAREAKKNCLIISNTFPMPKDWPLLQHIPIAARLSKEIFVYRKS